MYVYLVEGVPHEGHQLDCNDKVQAGGGVLEVGEKNQKVKARCNTIAAAMFEEKSVVSYKEDCIRKPTCLRQHVLLCPYTIWLSILLFCDAHVER